MALSQGQSFISHIYKDVKSYWSLNSTIKFIYLYVLLVFRMGAEWQRIRSILNPRMLKPKHVSGYNNSINEVVGDFVKKVAWLRATKGNGVMVNNLAEELYKFSFEGKTYRFKQCLPNS